ncbi:MAG: hypothetical protein ACJ734_00125 [Gaiellaceae bacterium]
MIDPSLGTSSLLSHCLSPESEISWNKQGRNGISPTVAQLAAGDANCPAGGASITDAAGNTALDGPNTTVEAAANLDLKAGAIGKLESGGPTQVQGALVQLNGCSAPVARRGDLVVGSVTVGPDGGTFPFNNALILPIAATVCTG